MHEVIFQGTFFQGTFLQFSLLLTTWKLIGLVGTAMFAGRWLVQWLATKRAGRVVMPRMFWYMSVVGSLMTLSYFVWGKNDAVGILGNLFPSFVACYNLWRDIKPKTPPAPEPVSA